MKWISICAVMMATSVASIQAQSSWITYRNTEFDFRVLYPPTWVRSTPRGENVRLAVYAPGSPSPATCNTLVRPIPELATSTQAELNAVVSKVALIDSEWQAVMGGKWPDYRLLETSISKVDNRPAYFAVAEHSAETVDKHLYFKAMMVATFSPGQLWIHSCSARGISEQDARRKYAEFESVMRRVLGSLVFETWRQ